MGVDAIRDADPVAEVREATVDDELDVRRVFDAAMLESDAVSDAVAVGDVLVAVDTEGSVLGALVLVPFDAVALPDAVATESVENSGTTADVGMHVDAVAVRQRRRGQGVGRALVVAALDREQRLTVAFDPRVRAFYDALDFDVVVAAAASSDGRVWAERRVDASLASDDVV